MHEKTIYTLKIHAPVQLGEIHQQQDFLLQAKNKYQLSTQHSESSIPLSTTQFFHLKRERTQKTQTHSCNKIFEKLIANQRRRRRSHSICRSTTWSSGDHFLRQILPIPQRNFSEILPNSAALLYQSILGSYCIGVQSLPQWHKIFVHNSHQYYSCTSCHSCHNYHTSKLTATGFFL